MNITSLGEFINWERENRKLTVRDFATLIDVSPSQIHKFSKYTDGNDIYIPATEDKPARIVGQPSLEFLYKLAKGTSTDLAAIIALIYPDATRIHPTALIITDKVDALPADRRELFDQFLNWLSLQGDNKTE